MKPKIKLLRGATQAFRIIATQDLSQAQSVRLQLRHSERTFVLNMPFVIDGRSIRFVWYANDQPYLGNYEIRAEADWGEGNVGACDWADVEGIELVDHSYKTRRCNTSTLEVETVELNGDLMQTAMGLSTYRRAPRANRAHQASAAGCCSRRCSSTRRPANWRYPAWRPRWTAYPSTRRPPNL